MSPSAIRILIVQLMAWISIPVLFVMAPWYFSVGALFMYFLYGGVGVALTFHRILSHGAFRVNKTVRRALILLASFANVGSAITWVSVHRAHHRYADTPKDPHSPQFMPWWYVMFGTMFSKVQVRFVPDLLRDPFCLFVHKWYYALQLPWIALLAWLGGWQAVLAFHLVPGGLTWLGGSLVNYLNHLSGYKPFDGQGTSTNNLLTGFLVFGEGWHNAHHASPTRPSTSVRWWEFDPLYWVGCLLGKPRT